MSETETPYRDSLIVLVNAWDEQKCQSLLTIAVGGTQQPAAVEPQPPPQKARRKGGGSGKPGPLSKAFKLFWQEGKINPTTAELRMRARECGRHYATDAKLIKDLKRSPGLYLDNGDGTWSLVNPPKGVTLVAKSANA